MSKMCQDFHEWRHRIWQLWNGVGITPKQTNQEQEYNRRRDVFMQADDLAFKAAINIIT